jgi:CubicO group peptidase (beta-lactamase class C family)
MLPILRQWRIKTRRPFDPITTRDTEHEVEPRTVGMTRRGVDAIWRAVEDLYATGLQPAISLCIRRRGKVVLNRAIGHASGNGPGDAPGAPRLLATPATPFCIFSSSKAVTAMLIHLLDDRGALHISDRVVEYIPEFGKHGKQWITLQHVLTHRAGIPSVAGHNDLDLLADWDRIIELLCDSKPVSRPGRRLSYHALTGGFILGEIVRRTTGRDIRQVLHDEVLDPLGFRRMNYGVPPADLPAVARNYFTGPPVPPPISLLVKRALGVSFADAVTCSNDPRYLTAIIPSGNIVATAEEVSRFFQLLLSGGALQGSRIFESRTIRRATTETSYLELDLTLGLPVHYGMGLMLGADYLSPFGLHTRHAYGHIGFINVFTWADPDRRIAVALLTSGKPFVSGHIPRLARVIHRISTYCGVG